MKKVWDIYILDWRRVFRSKAAIFLMVSLMVLPSLYAWFNIKALWDPYGNTSGIKIAVANDDQGATISTGIDKEKHINIGDELVRKLMKNENLGWTFVSKKKADEGVRNGDYYASLYVPKDFSHNLSSILTDSPEKAKIIFTINDKINAITPKIASTGANAVTKQITQEFINTVSKSLLSEFDKAGVQLEKDLPTIRRLETKLYQVRDALPEINEFGEQAKELKSRLPAIQQKADKLVSLTGYIPTINSAGQSILKVKDALPLINQAGQQVLAVQSKIPEIRNMAAKINELNNNFDTIKNTLDDGLTEANQALTVVNKTQSLLPKIQELANNSQGYVNVANDFLDSLDGSFDKISSTVKMNLQFINQIAGSVSTVADQLGNHAITPDQALQLLTHADSLLTQEVDLLARQITFVQNLANAGINGQPIQNLLSTLTVLSDRVQSQQDLVQKAIGAIKADPGRLPASLQQIQSTANQVQQDTGRIVADYDSVILPTIQAKLNQIKGDIANANDVVAAAQKELPNVSNLLGNTKKTLQDAIDMLSKYQRELPALEKTLNNATVLINNNLDKVIDEVNFAASFYQNDFPAMQQQIEKGAAFVKNDLPGLTSDLTRASALISEKMPQLVDAINIASSLSQNELPEFNKTVQNAATKLNELKEKTNLEGIIHMLRRDVKSDSDFLAEPVQLKEVKDFPIANYGSASSPFYTALAIWVGALLLVSLLSVDVEMPREMYRPHHFYFGRGLTFLTVALIQAAIVSLGDIFLLHVDVHNKLAFFLFSLLISFVFMSIVYTLVSIFGNIGKGLAIILLVLQISSSGGNFPIEVSSEFFQRIYPFLPFTYAVKLLREGLGGVIWHNAIIYMIVLLSVAVIFILIGTALKKPLMKLVNRFTEDARKSKIFH
ncbi:YhgE/Pip domain-containing protein [Bacillus testis]|uniref:YhgE/Pip domain-containing protein n=1 Tax=Bacillus testis TaxID=1622072 RepID=UPI00067F6153|nr:YhgE/Pip domain-containing protein [Bacillus testis]